MKRFILGVLAWFIFAAVAFAQSNCATRTVVLERLVNGYGETRQSVGVASNDTIVEIFASMETGTWTILVTTASGLTCFVASGQNFEHVPEEYRKAGKPL